MPVSMILLAGAVVATAPDAARDDRRWDGGYVGIGIGLDLTGDGDDRRRDFDTTLDGMFGDRTGASSGNDAAAPGFCHGPVTATPPGSRRHSPRTGYAGHVGYDLQFGDVVVGAVGEAGRGAVADSTVGTGTGGAPARPVFVRTLDWSAQGRVRAGYALGDTLPYLTGGATLARIDHGIVDDVATGSARDRDRRGGWGYLVGGGVEQRVSDAASIGLLYTYSSVKDAAARDYAVRPGIDMGYGDRRFNWHSVRVRASLRF